MATVESRGRFTPHFSIYVAIPVFIFSGIIAYYAIQLIEGTKTNWSHVQPYAVGVVVVAVLCGVTISGWKAYKHVVTHRADMQTRRALIGVADSVQSVIQYAIATGSNLDISFNDQMVPTQIKIASLGARGKTNVTEEITNTEPLALPAPASIPAQVSYEDVRRQVPKGHALLGVGAKGLQTCDFSKILTCLILGGSGTGKSNTVSIKVEEAIADGWRILVVDPHKRKEDSLYNRIKQYAGSFIRFDGMEDGVAQSEEEIKTVFTWFLQEFKHRLDTGDRSFGDVLLICDEVSNITDSDDEEVVKMIKKIARICGNESRGFGMAGWFINQNATGIAWLRKVVMTVITHKLNMMSERKIACNDNDALARKMDAWPKGRVYVYGLSFDEIYELQMPLQEQVVESVPANNYYTAQTVRNLPPIPSTPSVGSDREASGEASGRNTDENSQPTDLSTIKQLRDIGKRLKKGEDASAIVKSYGLPYGRATQEMGAVVDMVAKQIEQEEA